MVLSTSNLPGSTLFSADYNELVFTVWNHSSRHSTSYAPITGSTVYIAGTSTDLFSGTSTSYYPFSTDVFAVSTHLHTGIYAPAFSTSDYMPTFSTAAYAVTGHGHTSTGTYSTEGHLHAGVYTPFGAASSDHTHAVATTAAAGFLVMLAGASSKYLSSTGGWTEPPASTAGGGGGSPDLEGGWATSVYGAISPLNGGSSA
jgi:hypothetical protein